MAYAAALGAALCGFKSRSPYHFRAFRAFEPLGLSFDSPALGPSGHPALAITPHAHVSPCQHAS